MVWNILSPDQERLGFTIDFLGNKIDRDDREIPTEVGEEFSNRHGMYFLETSAKGSENVERLFSDIAHELLQVNDGDFFFFLVLQFSCD